MLGLFEFMKRFIDKCIISLLPSSFPNEAPATGLFV